MENIPTSLPDHLLELVVERLCLPDLFRFGLVCKPWRSVCDPSQFQNHVPWLIVPWKTNCNSNSMAFETETAGFYSYRDGKIYKLELPELSNRRICGSFPGGWLMTVHENSEIQLLNPFMSDGSRASSIIHLPPLSKFPRVLEMIERKENDCLPWSKYTRDTIEHGLFYVCTRFDSPNNACLSSKYMRDIYIHKVAMSSSPIANGTIVMAVQGVGCSLAFYRIGGDQQVWTTVTSDKQHSCAYHDLTYYKGKFYAVHNNGFVVVVDDLKETQGETPLFSPSIKQVISTHPRELATIFYIMESAGDLLVVFRYYIKLEKRADLATPINYSNINSSLYPYKTVGFKVVKLDFGTPNKWVEVESLGDRSLFVGYNTSFSTPSIKFSGCKANCIYFTDNHWRCFYGGKFGGHDFGIFNLQDDSIEKFLYPSDNLLVMPPPVWFAPNL